MSALSASTNSLHRDNRSESRSYKRDKEHSAKWAMGTRPSYGVKYNYNYEVIHGSEEQQAKVRPEKRWSDRYATLSHELERSHKLTRCPFRYGSYKTHHNVTLTNTHGGEFGKAAGRIVRKRQAMQEVAYPTSLTSSFVESLPSGTSGHLAQTPSLDAGVMYSYDEKTSPRKVVGLDSLVEKAEKDFNNRETAKLVKAEYEILDVEGEIVKKGKKGSPKHTAQVVMVQEDEDWECI